MTVEHTLLAALATFVITAIVTYGVRWSGRSGYDNPSLPTRAATYQAPRMPAAQQGEPGDRRNPPCFRGVPARQYHFRGACRPSPSKPALAAPCWVCGRAKEACKGH